MTVDPVTLNLLGTQLIAIPREMAANMRRAAYSTVVREARDFSVGLLAVDGSVVAQAEMIPMQTGGISEAFWGLAREVDVRSATPDDAFLVNDPFRGGQHLQDLILFTPVFHAGALVAFAACVAHHVDVGGAMPGLSAEATELYQEGLRLPLARFSVSRDWEGGFVEKLIAANVRVPTQVIGDLNAQFTANRTAERRLGEMLDRYGRERVLAVMAGLQDYAERRMREGIAAIPDGVYRACEDLEGAPWGIDRIRVRATVTVAGSDIEVDFDGTDPQVPGNVNAPFASTVSAVQAAVRGVLHERDIPFNQGCNRPVRVRAPYGSVLNPRPPAAVRARMTPTSRAFNAVVRALSEAVPERVIADGFDTTTAASLSHLDPVTGEYGVVIEVLGGGWGAAATHDGADALDNPLSNCANAPVEALEVTSGYFRVVEFALADGYGGDGRFRGGLGFRRTYRSLCDGVRFAAYSDHHRRGARGLFGGGDGAPGAFVVRRRDGRCERLPCVASVVLDEGDEVTVLVGGGGGYGDPALRSPQLRERDRREGRAP
jgi:N-methylhydantoinase B